MAVSFDFSVFGFCFIEHFLVFVFSNWIPNLILGWDLFSCFVCTGSLSLTMYIILIFVYKLFIQICCKTKLLKKQKENPDLGHVCILENQCVKRIMVVSLSNY